jgi:transposase
VRALWHRDRKNDASDAELLARLLRADPELLCPIQHRSEEAQTDILQLRARDTLVHTLAKLANAARGMAKSLGYRLSKSSPLAFARKVRAEIPEQLQPALLPLLESMATISTQIRAMDKQLAKLAQTKYPQTERLRAVNGVGPITSLAFVLTVDDPNRFAHSRDMGPYLGLVPRQDQSGASDKQLGITKSGDGFLRRLLVSSAQYILGPFGKPCGLRSFGERLSSRGGKNAKRRAVVAVARKLAVLLHRLWVSGAPYDPARGLGQSDGRPAPLQVRTA